MIKNSMENLRNYHGVSMVAEDYEIMIALEQKIGQIIPPPAPALSREERVTYFYAEDNRVINLNFGAVKFTEFPDEITQLTELRKLFLSRDPIKFLPDSICNLKKLEYLGVFALELSNLPEALSQLESLKSFYIAYNNFDTFPQVICKLKNLEHLQIINTALKHVPDEIGNLKKLRVFNLSQNALEDLPSGLSRCENLEKLTIHCNNIKKFPDEYKNMRNLTNIHIMGNHIKELPQWLTDFENLDIINVDNSIKENAKGTTLEVIKYLEDNIRLVIFEKNANDLC